MHVTVCTVAVESLSVMESLQGQVKEKEWEMREVVERYRCQLEESEKGRREAVEKMRQKAARLEEVQALLAEVEETAREVRGRREGGVWGVKGVGCSGWREGETCM